MNISVPFEHTAQPPAYSLRGSNELTVAVASLSLGGAERIVLDWADRIYPRWRVHLLVLRDRKEEWQVPSHIRVTRLSEPRFKSITPRLASEHLRRVQYLSILGEELSKAAVPVCVCHLLKQDERAALASSGATVVNVLHNAKEGWMEDVTGIDATERVIAVSDACRKDLRSLGFEGSVSVVRHIPPRRIFAADARERFRRQWNIPEDALVIGMVGAVKTQKNYRRALRLFKELLRKREAYLVIVGGPVNVREEGRAQWEATVREIDELGLGYNVAMPGFIPDAASCLPAFDLVLNTSDYEGMSIATLEALQSGVAVVAAKVGGQGEVDAKNLFLMPPDATDADWVEAMLCQLGRQYVTPEWSQFPSYRLWTLLGLVRQTPPSDKTLFVTSNLNSGGAQRSLVNLARSIASRLDFEVVVAGDSSSSFFYRQLKLARVSVSRTSEQNDAFSHAESLVHKICREGIRTVCFWNVDRRVKLLLLKALEASPVKFIDVSPGLYSFEEIDGVASFQELIAFSAADYYRRLDTLVLKYDGPHPEEFSGEKLVIRNGVQLRKRKEHYRIEGAPKVVVNGRIAPSKFLEEIIEAMRLVRKRLPDAELHVFGGAEESEKDYSSRVRTLAKHTLGDAVRFYGTDFTAPERLSRFDAYVVLGKHQGCPNALLEALSCGLPVVANDDGGTREQVIDGVTGVLIPDCSPKRVAEALIRLLTERRFAERLGRAGRAHVEKQFSMEEMANNYLDLFSSTKSLKERLSLAG
jgi:glycosyltransferase involved in cell wall biosynthesis